MARQHRIEAVLGDVLANAGYELVEASLLGGHKVLRLTIDRLQASENVPMPPPVGEDMQAQGGIDLADCSRVSRLADAALQATGDASLFGHDNLEVSSPGLERPLTKPQHFKRFVGLPVRLRLHAAEAEAASAKGLVARLADADDEGCSLHYQTSTELAQPHRPSQVSYAQIAGARLIHEQPRHTSDQTRRGQRASARAKEVPPWKAI